MNPSSHEVDPAVGRLVLPQRSTNVAAADGITAMWVRLAISGTPARVPAESEVILESPPVGLDRVRARQGWACICNHRVRPGRWRPGVNAPRARRSRRASPVRRSEPSHVAEVMQALESILN